MLVETNHAGYYKDTETGVIINNNEEEYKRFIAARDASKKNNGLCKKIEEIENDMRDIKSLLQQIIDGKN